MEDQKTKRNKIILGIVSVLFVEFVIVLVIWLIFIKKDEQIAVSGGGDCVQNISDERKKEVDEAVFRVVSEQKYAKDNRVANNYEAKIREGSCKVSENEFNVYDASYILDIDELKYSFRLEYSWINDTKRSSKDVGIDLGSIKVLCLKDDEMIYPDFGCSENEAVVQEDDAILKVLPYIKKGLNATARGSKETGYKIVIEYDTSENKSGISNQEFADGCKAEVLKYLQEKGIDVTKYEVTMKKKDGSF